MIFICLSSDNVVYLLCRTNCVLWAKVVRLALGFFLRREHNPHNRRWWTAPWTQFSRPALKRRRGRASSHSGLLSGHLAIIYAGLNTWDDTLLWENIINTPCVSAGLTPAMLTRHDSAAAPLQHSCKRWSIAHDVAAEILSQCKRRESH